MLSPEEVDALISEVVRAGSLPLGVGDRIDVAIGVVESTIRRLAPRVTLDVVDGPTAIVPAAPEPEKTEPPE